MKSLLLAALIGAILRWQQYRKAKVVAELQRANTAPYLWNPKTAQQNDYLIKILKNIKKEVNLLKKK